jgi:NAD(P)-dependent dehydrogenase (short-subunit alcohol dehydrogenase family)
MSPRPDHGEYTYEGHGRLKGKVALVTGGDSGIGKAVCIAFAREGAHVLFAYLNEHEDAEDTVRWVEATGCRAVAVPGDIGDEEHCKSLVQRTLDEFGRLDILINNAAFSMDHQTIEEIPSEEWDHTFKTNLYSMFYLCKAALSRMSVGGAIINVSSVETYHPDPKALAYATSKGAIVTFTKALAEESLKRGIRANVVAPGPTWTPIIITAIEPERSYEYGTQTPMKRPAQPREFAPAFVFLASKEASYINGELFVIAGGMPLP